MRLTSKRADKLNRDIDRALRIMVRVRDELMRTYDSGRVADLNDVRVAMQESVRAVRSVKDAGSAMGYLAHRQSRLENMRKGGNDD